MFPNDDGAAKREGDAPGQTTTLRASERVTNAELLEALGVAVYMTDAEGVITDYNEAAARLWGRRPDLYRDLWCGSWRLFWPDGAPMEHSACPMAVTLKENRPVRGAEAIAERPDGTRVWFVPYPTPLRDDTGALVGAVNVLVDITDRKLSEQKLIEKDRRLTDALAIKDEFLGLVSHELKTPVTTILGNAQILQRSDGRLPVDARDGAIEDVLRESERLRSIIDNSRARARRRASRGRAGAHRPSPRDRSMRRPVSRAPSLARVQPAPRQRRRAGHRGRHSRRPGHHQPALQRREVQPRPGANRRPYHR
jgi:PAS domain S-box-containing protein